jgi:hypothetical protein
MAKASGEKITAARSTTLEALRSSEIAILDHARYLGVQLLSLVSSSDYRDRAVNRVQMASLALQRIEGSVQRLVKRLAIEPIDVFGASQAIRVSNRLANSWKHGLGGQAKNATIVDGFILVRRGDGYRNEAGEERVHVVGMTVVDATEGPFSSHNLFETCVRDWSILLADVVPEVADWRERVAPHPKGPSIDLPSAVGAVVPLGSTIRFALPEDLVSQLKAEAKRRGASA